MAKSTNQRRSAYNSSNILYHVFEYLFILKVSVSTSLKNPDPFHISSFRPRPTDPLPFGTPFVLYSQVYKRFGAAIGWAVWFVPEIQHLTKGILFMAF